MSLLALGLIVLGTLCVAKYIAERQKEKEKKPFILLASTLAFIWMFPGVALIILGCILWYFFM